MTTASPKLSDRKLAKRYGRRGTGTPLFEPGEFGYHCPNGHTANQLTWSEFNDHIWCYDCNKDYHYAQDCYLIRPEWLSEDQWADFLKGLPAKPAVRPGTISGNW